MWNLPSRGREQNFQKFTRLIVIPTTFTQINNPTCLLTEASMHAWRQSSSGSCRMKASSQRYLFTRTSTLAQRVVEDMEEINKLKWLSDHCQFDSDQPWLKTVLWTNHILMVLSIFMIYWFINVATSAELRNIIWAKNYLQNLLLGFEVQFTFQVLWSLINR